MLNAYFAAAVVSAIAEDCHNQRIASCPCIVSNIRTEDGEGNVIFEACKADFSSASIIFQAFATSQINTAAFSGMIDEHNIHFGEEVSVVFALISLSLWPPPRVEELTLYGLAWKY